eukprot:5371216-Amphidinium_carterae.1
MAESHQCRPQLFLANDNTAAIIMMKKGPTNPFRTRHISMRANYIFDLLENGIINAVEYIESAVNPSDALTKGPSSHLHELGRRMLGMSAHALSRDA